jgi:hypothetical protein
MVVEGIKVQKGGRHISYMNLARNDLIYLDLHRKCAYVPLGKKLFPIQKSLKMQYDFQSRGYNFLSKGT